MAMGEEEKKPVSSGSPAPLRGAWGVGPRSERLEKLGRIAGYVAHCGLVLEMYVCAIAGEVVRALGASPHDRKDGGVKPGPFDPY